MPCIEVNLITRLGVIALFSSPDPKGHVSYCHHWASVVCHPSVRPLTFHILINSSEATGPIWTKLWWNIEENSIFSNRSHIEWRVGLTDTILKGDHPRTIPAKFVLIWLSGFRGEDLNVIFYQNMPNLHEIFSASLFHLGILWDKNHI
jgi:hypothetical protein